MIKEIWQCQKFVKWRHNFLISYLINWFFLDLETAGFTLFFNLNKTKYRTPKFATQPCYFSFEVRDIFQGKFAYLTGKNTFISKGTLRYDVYFFENVLCFCTSEPYFEFLAESLWNASIGAILPLPLLSMQK